MPPTNNTQQSQPRWLLIFSIFWLGFALLATFAPQTVGSPDEAINKFFIERFGNTGELQVESDLTTPETSYWHPRSVRVQEASILPLSFLGLILTAGPLERVTGFGAVLTPLLALGALFALYAILKRFWSLKWAFLGTGLVALHPVWWLYQTLPYMHNGAFASLLIIAAWRLMKLWDVGTGKNALWFGLAFGLTMWMRPVEILWTGPLIAIVLLAQRQWKIFFLVVGLVGILQLPWLIVGWQLYGSSLGAGYSSAQIEAAIEAEPSGRSSLAENILTPPGGWSWNWLHSTWNYLFLLVPAWGLAVLVALFGYLRRIAPNRKKLVKISLVVLVLTYLAIYYGSWNLYPLEMPGTIGALASYARYWIPLYVAMIAGVLWVLKRMAPLRWVLVITVSALLVSQVSTILWHPNAGVFARRAHDQNQQLRRDAVFANTPADAAIIAGHMDKVLWPERVVAFALPRSDEQWKAFVSLAKERPVYIYVTPLQYDYPQLDAELQEVGFTLGTRHQVINDELWEVKSL